MVSLKLLSLKNFYVHTKEEWLIDLASYGAYQIHLGDNLLVGKPSILIFWAVTLGDIRPIHDSSF